MPAARAVRLSILALIVTGLAILALWRVGTPVKESSPVGTTGALSRDAAGPLKGVAELLANNAVGREASLDAVQIREIIAPHMFWVGPSDEQRMFVVLNADARRDPKAAIQPGARATLIGVVRAALPPEEAMKEWHIGAATAKSVADRGTYLDCREVIAVQ